MCHVSSVLSLSCFSLSLGRSFLQVTRLLYLIILNMSVTAIHTVHREAKPHNDRVRLSSNGNLDLNTSLDVDDDLLDGLGGSVKTIAK